jgi:radical SAM protein with 4Fe4S-binding SPASM domain
MAMKEIGCENFPLVLEIQTITACNAGCVICPHRTVSGSLPSGIMGMDLFKRIIDQVKNPWGTRIIPYFNNEPFLDPLIFDRVAYINDKCPGSEIEISTNASRLDQECQKKLEGLVIKDLRLSVFGFSEESYKRAMPGLNWSETKRNIERLAKNKELRANIGQVSLIMIDYPEIDRFDIEKAREFCRENFIKFEFWGFLDRSGNVERFTNGVSKDSVFGCEQRRPLERMHINFKGDVVLCCMDWKWEHVLGNVAESSIDEIWNSEKYKQYREAIYSNGDPKVTDLCRKCKISL